MLGDYTRIPSANGYQAARRARTTNWHATSSNISWRCTAIAALDGPQVGLVTCLSGQETKTRLAGVAIKPGSCGPLQETSWSEQSRAQDCSKVIGTFSIGTKRGCRKSGLNLASLSQRIQCTRSWRVPRQRGVCCHYRYRKTTLGLNQSQANAGRGKLMRMRSN